MSSSLVPSCPRCRKRMQPKIAKSPGSAQTTPVFECDDCIGLIVGHDSLISISPRLDFSSVKRGAEGERTCQRCERKMLTLKVGSLFRKVQLDECPVCLDVYFDFTELGRVARKPIHVGILDEAPKAHHVSSSPPVSELLTEWLHDL